jgi:hypothetical protein
MVKLRRTSWKKLEEEGMARPERPHGGKGTPFMEKFRQTATK